MRYRRVKIAGATYFFTLVTEHRRPLFGEPSAVTLFLGAVDTIRSRHPFNVDAYVVLPDHLHAVWTLPEDDAKFSTRWHHGLAAAPRDWPHSSFQEWVNRGAYDPTWGSDVLPALPDWAQRYE